MRYLTLAEILALHYRIIQQFGGAQGIRDLGAVESAVAQPQMTFSGEELYPTVESKAACICFALVLNHPFKDGNKRIGHAAMEAFLVLNGFELTADVNESEELIVRLAAGQVTRESLVDWVKAYIGPLG